MNSISEIEQSNETKEELGDFKLILEKVWFNIPLFIKTFFIITIILYILNLKLTFISYYLINITYYTILKFQIWRLFTSVFITTNILEIIFAFFVYVKYASVLETSLGTIKYTLIFFMNSFFIQIINLFIYSLLSVLIPSKFNPDIKLQKNSGLWGIVMCEMTLLCITNPESPMKLMILPFTVKAKIYPIILILIYILINFIRIDVDIISGFIYGFFYFYFLKTKLQISEIFVQNLENTDFFKSLSHIKGFISVNHISSGIPISITKVSTIDIEQEKEKLKGKGVVVEGCLEEGKLDENEIENDNENIAVNTEKNDNNENLDSNKIETTE